MTSRLGKLNRIALTSLMMKKHQIAPLHIISVLLAIIVLKQLLLLVVL
jgi:hypothetical protein